MLSLQKVEETVWLIVGDRGNALLWWVNVAKNYELSGIWKQPTVERFQIATKCQDQHLFSELDSFRKDPGWKRPDSHFQHTFSKIIEKHNIELEKILLWRYLFSFRDSSIYCIP